MILEKVLPDFTDEKEEKISWKKKRFYLFSQMKKKWKNDHEKKHFACFYGQKKNPEKSKNWRKNIQREKKALHVIIDLKQLENI